MKPLDRRTLLVAGGAGIGLVVAFSLWPREIGSALSARPRVPARVRYQPAGAGGLNRDGPKGPVVSAKWPTSPHAPPKPYHGCPDAGASAIHVRHTFP